MSRKLALTALVGAVLSALVLWWSADDTRPAPKPVPRLVRETPGTLNAQPVITTPEPLVADTQKARLTIRVIDGQGKPPQGGRITLQHDTSSNNISLGSWSVDLDQEGQGRFSGLEASVYHASVVTDQASTGNQGNIHLAAGQTKEITLQVKEGWGIRGRAVLKDGSDCGRCGVSVRMNGSPRDWYVSSGFTGRFEVDSLEPGTGALEISFESPGRTLFGFHSFSLEAPGFTDLGDVVLGVHGRVAGAVYAHDGTLLENAMVFVVRRSNDEAVSATVKTDESGRFVIEGLGEGHLELGIIPGDGWEIHEPPGDIPVSNPSQVAIRLKKRVPKPKLTARLRFREAIDSKTLFRIAAFDNEGRANTSAGGSRSSMEATLQIRDLELGKSYFVQVSAGTLWGRSQKMVVALEGNVVDVIVDREGCSITGTIVGDQDQRPMAYATVSLKHTREGADSTLGTVVSVESGKDGTFRIDGVPPDLPSWLEISRSEFSTMRIEVPAGGAALGTIRLNPK